MRVVAVILGGVIGAVIGLYGGAYGRIIYMRLTLLTYVPGMDFKIPLGGGRFYIEFDASGLLFATAGAVLGGAVGVWLGIWLTSRSRAD